MAVDMELEAVLRAPELEMPPYPPKVITLANSKKMVVRQVKREDVPTLLKTVRPTLDIPRDYYDIVGARLYAELLGWYRYRVRNEYCLVGQIDGFVVGMVNGRMWDKNVGISLHTLAIDRGLRVGAHLFASKMEYHIEYLGQQEVWITAESPIGFRRWMIEYGLIKQENVQHELGGATSYKLTRDLYFETKPRLVAGTRPVPKDLLDKAMQQVLVASEADVTEKICGVKGR
ncbi:MAG: GNAT family N-acetyltransferase [Anaerolineaceae bacterium]